MSSKKEEAKLIPKRVIAFHRPPPLHPSPPAAIFLDIRQVAHVFSAGRLAIYICDRWLSKCPSLCLNHKSCSQEFFLDKLTCCMSSLLPLPRGEKLPQLLTLLQKSRAPASRKGKKKTSGNSTLRMEVTSPPKDERSTRSIQTVWVLRRPALLVPVVKSLQIRFFRNCDTLLSFVSAQNRHKTTYLSSRINI